MKNENLIYGIIGSALIIAGVSMKISSISYVKVLF